MTDIQNRREIKDANPPKCKDCRWCRPCRTWFIFGGHSFSRCVHPLLVYDCFDYLVTGKARTAKFCSTKRVDPLRDCGPSGKYFETKKDVVPQFRTQADYRKWRSKHFRKKLT